VSQEVREQEDEDLYDCQTCPVAAHLAELATDPDNAAAWDLFHQVVTRFTGDTFMTGIVFQRLTRRLDDDTYADVLKRCEILYDALCPAPEKTEE
jgi:hypothetical protein